ncbi:MAG: DNA polymerase III subunit chi [Caulobacteraceae bacterium]
MTDSPCEVWFYHLERAALDQVLPELLEKTLARGWRALVRSSDPARIEHLDSWLWAFREDSFLPHGPAGEASSPRQPVLLTTSEENANGAQALFLLDGAEPGDISSYERCILVFDGRDEGAVTAARVRWSAFKAAGHPTTYWREGESRGWEKQG